MFSKNAIASLALTLAASAQNTVLVGLNQTAPGGLFQFSPNSITAAKGSTITFVFNSTPGNHSVTQSSFEQPCRPLQGGFDSGTAFVPANFTGTKPTWNLTIEDDSKPIWFYCKQPLPQFHCGVGMVGVINPTAGGSSNSIQQFQAAAQSVSNNPGTQGTQALSGVGAAATAAPSPTNAAPAPSGSGAAGASGGSGSGGAPAPSHTGGANAIGVSSALVGFVAAVFSLMA